VLKARERERGEREREREREGGSRSFRNYSQIKSSSKNAA